MGAMAMRCSEQMAHSDSQVLVLAPRFPSINQPWIDTYLEQLLCSELPFSVVSHRRDSGVHFEKVERLQLHERVVVLPAQPSTLFRMALRGLLTSPWREARRIWSAQQTFSSDPRRRRRSVSVLMAIATRRIFESLPNVRVVHSHSLDMAYACLPELQDRQLPLVITFHGLKPSGVPQTPEIWSDEVFAAASTVIVNTQFARQQAAELGCPIAKIVVLPQGLPLHDFPFLPRQPICADNTLEVLSVGRFHRDKGQQYSLLALCRLVRDGVRIHWHFAGVGPNKAALEALARRLGVSQFVTFHVGVSVGGLRELYQRCQLFVLASVGSTGVAEHVETQGVVLQEAQASGCIPIATRVGGIPECITDGVDGMLITDRSHRAIATAIRELCDKSDEWESMRRCGRTNVEERFSAERVGEQMAVILRAASQPLSEPTTDG